MTSTCLAKNTTLPALRASWRRSRPRGGLAFPIRRTTAKHVLAGRRRGRFGELPAARTRRTQLVVDASTVLSERSARAAHVVVSLDQAQRELLLGVADGAGGRGSSSTGRSAIRRAGMSLATSALRRRTMPRSTTVCRAAGRKP